MLTATGVRTKKEPFPSRLRLGKGASVGSQTPTPEPTKTRHNSDAVTTHASVESPDDKL